MRLLIHYKYWQNKIRKRQQWNFQRRQDNISPWWRGCTNYSTLWCFICYKFYFQIRVTLTPLLVGPNSGSHGVQPLWQLMDNVMQYYHFFAKVKYFYRSYLRHNIIMHLSTFTWIKTMIQCTVVDSVYVILSTNNRSIF